MLVFALSAVPAAISYAQESYDLGNRLFASRDYLKAQNAYEKAIRESSGEIAAHSRYMLGRSFEELDNWQKAEENYQLLWRLAPRSSWADDALLLVATHLASSQNPDDLNRAKKLCEKLRTLYPNSPLFAEASCILGETNIRLGNFDEAFKTLVEVIQRDDACDIFDRAYFALGRLYSDPHNPKKDLDKALDAFKWVTEQTPESCYASWANFSAGNILRQQKKWEHAKLYFQAVLDRYDGTFCAAATVPILALSRVEQERFLRGRESFEQLLRLIHKGPRPIGAAKAAPTELPTAKVLQIQIMARETYSDDKRASYKGDVRVSVGDMKVFADQAVCELQTHIFRTSGGTTLQLRDRFALNSRRLTFDLKNQRGIASGDVRFVQRVSGSGGAAEPKVRTVRRLEFLIKDGQIVPVSEQE